MKKEPFVFSYTMPSLDWYEEYNVELKEDDFDFYRLEHRFGQDNQWWLVGINVKREREEKSIGWLWSGDVKRFIEWAKDERGGSRILEIHALSSDMNLLELIKTQLF